MTFNLSFNLLVCCSSSTKTTTQKMILSKTVVNFIDSEVNIYIFMAQRSIGDYVRFTR